jgi:transcriptional regulator of acetoin/glycerol metabolism
LAPPTGPLPLPPTWNEFKKLKRQVCDVAVQQLERQFLINALHRCGGNVLRAAAEIGIQRTNLHALMRKHGLTSRRKDLDRVA